MGRLWQPIGCLRSGGSARKKMLTDIEVIVAFANLAIGIVLGVAGAKGMMDGWR